MYVCIHADGVGDEETSGRGKDKLQKFLFEFEGTLEICGQGGCNLLEVIVNPNSEPVQETAGAGDDWSRGQFRFMYLH